MEWVDDGRVVVLMGGNQKKSDLDKYCLLWCSLVYTDLIYVQVM